MAMQTLRKELDRIIQDVRTDDVPFGTKVYVERLANALKDLTREVEDIERGARPGRTWQGGPR